MVGEVESKRCCRCGATKPVGEFNWRRKALGQRDTMCRPCRAAYKHEHYSANKARYITQAAESKKRLRLARTKWLLDYFRAHPCRDCGESDPVVLDFDHLEDKSFAIGESLTYRRWERILEEIAKCDVVCANCHRRRTARRHGSVRAALANDAAGALERATGLEPAL
jgi:hypothetical protein